MLILVPSASRRPEYPGGSGDENWWLLIHLIAALIAVVASSETLGQSVGSGEKAGRKFSNTGKRAPGYRLSPSYFQKFKRMRLLIGDKKCFVLFCPINEQFLLSSFREFVHGGYCFDHGLSGSCTKEMHGVRKLSV